MSELVAGAIFVTAYVLIATEKVNRVVVALTGAGLMLATRILDADDAFHSTEYGIDWNVIFLLLGMMVIVGVLRQTGLFEYLAVRAAQKAGARPFRVLVMLVTITAVASAMLDNVTTVLLIAPVTIVVTNRLGVPAAPYLIAEALASNIGGTSTLVGDPPNIIVGLEANLTYVDFLTSLTPFIVFLLIVFIGLMRVLFRSAFVARPERAAEVMAMDAREQLVEPELIGRSLAVLGLVTVAFVLHGVLHVDPSVVALLGAGLLVLLARRDPAPFLREVEWPTLAFFAGLFIMVGALIKVGIVAQLAQAATELTGGNLLLATMLLLWASGFLSAVVDNIPYVATMAPLVTSLIHGMPAGQDTDVLWWALVLGADLGGNATAIGASANVVVLGLAERYGQRISFMEFTKYGALVAFVTIGLSAPYLWLRYFVFG